MPPADNVGWMLSMVELLMAEYRCTYHEAMWIFPLAKLIAPIPLGIALGLFVGKQLGIFGSSWLAIKSGLCRMPEGATWPQLYAVGIIAGIGFTMSLFIGMLAFTDPAHAADVRIGVLGGSMLSAIAGYALLRAVSPIHRPSAPTRG